MLLSVISDVHANDLAFDACLAHSRKLGVSRIVLLGDLVGYGAEPETVTRTAALLSAAGAIVIKGNHDDAVAFPDDAMNPVAAAAMQWTRQKLSPESRAFLSALPLSAEIDDLLFVHADAASPAHWHYVTNAAAAHRSLAATKLKITFCGHVHIPQLYCMTATGKLVTHVPLTGVSVALSKQHRWLAVIGSAGQPRDGNPAAAFATYDTATRMLTCRRVPYDVEAAVAKIRAAGLPEQLAARLLVGR